MSIAINEPNRGSAMTDRELATFGERLYEAVLMTPLPAGTILGLATAIRCNITWTDLPGVLRFAVFKIAAGCLADPPGEEQMEAAPEGQATPAPAEAAIAGQPSAEPSGPTHAEASGNPDQTGESKTPEKTDVERVPG